MKNETEILRGIPDSALPRLSNEQLICIALVVIMDVQRIEDAPLCKELRRRAEKAP